MLLALLGVALLAKGYWNATRDPVVRTATVAVADWPVGQPPLKLLLLSDIHVAGPDMPPERLARIIVQLNRLRPDLVLIAGDLVSEKRSATHIYTAAEVVAPLGKLRAPLGVVVAPGNHDHWFKPDALRGELEQRGLRVLQNEAIKLGPLVVGGSMTIIRATTTSPRPSLRSIALAPVSRYFSRTARTSFPTSSARSPRSSPATPIAARSVSPSSVRFPMSRATATALRAAT